MSSANLDETPHPPRRRVVKKRIAETIEKLVSDQSKNFEQKLDLDESEVASEINRVCFCRYASDDGLQRCADYQTELDRIHALHDSSETVSSTTKFMALMSVARPILRQALSDPELEWKHSDIKKSDVHWLLRFIDMLLARKNVSSIQQNISITYFSCFRPLFEKLNGCDMVDDDVLFGTDAYFTAEGEWLFE